MRKSNLWQGLLIFVMLCVCAAISACGKQESPPKPVATQPAATDPVVSTDPVTPTETVAAERIPVALSIPSYRENDRYTMEVHIAENGYISIVERVQELSGVETVRDYPLYDLFTWSDQKTTDEIKHIIGYVEEAKAKYKKYNGVNPQGSGSMTFDSQYYRLLATKEQLIVLSEHFGTVRRAFSYLREAKIMLGVLDEDAPRLTLEQAESEIRALIERERPSTANIKYIVSAAHIFRKYAEVDYYDESSSMFAAVFYLNDAKDQFLRLYDSREIEYHDTRENIVVVMYKEGEEDSFVSVLDMMERGEIPPIRTDEKAPRQ